MYGVVKKTVEISDQLNSLNIKSQFFHGGISSEDKKNRLNDWLQGKITVMVATNAFGMGIDHPEVRLCFSYSITREYRKLFPRSR